MVSIINDIVDMSKIEVRSQAHALKGAAASIAAKLLSQAASQLECAGKGSNAPVFATLFQGIQTELDRLAAFISKDDWMEMAKKSNAQEHVRQSCDKTG